MPRMHALHLTADLGGCAPEVAALRDAQALRTLCLKAVADAGLKAVGELFHVFPPPGGVTGVVLLAESHLAVHTWPEHGTVTLDAFVCSTRGDQAARAHALVQTLAAHFGASQVSRQQLVRRDPAAPPPAAPPHRPA